MSEPLTASDIRAYLDWYAAMGVDASVADVPTDWFELSRQMTAAAKARAVSGPAGRHAPSTSTRRSTPPAAAPQQASAGSASTAPPSGRTRPMQGDETSSAPRPPQRPAIAAEPATNDQATASARAMAAKASTIAELRTALETFDGCSLKRTAKNLCFFRGAAQARLMLIGEAPGRDEDLAGEPFAGREGKMLEKMLAAIGLKLENVHVTNVVYWRPPGNRKPTPQETLVCQPFLERQIELVDPDILVFLGGAAAQQLLNASEGIMRLRGKWRDYLVAGKPRQAIATLHPEYLLQNPGAKRLAWRDLLAIQKALEALAPTEEKP